MIAILQIGTCHFALAPKEATKIIELMATGMRVERKYRKGRYYYHPPVEPCFRDDLELSMVLSDQMLSSEPKEEEPLPPPMARKPRRLALPAPR